MKLKVTGSIQPPRGTPGANSAYIVDLEIDVPPGLTEEQALEKAIMLCALLGIDGNEIDDAELPTHGLRRVHVIASYLRESASIQRAVESVRG